MSRPSSSYDAEMRVSRWEPGKEEAPQPAWVQQLLPVRVPELEQGEAIGELELQV